MNEGKGAHLKAINGKLIAAETSLEKLRDKEIGSSQSARQKAFVSNFFAPAEAMCTSVHHRSININDGGGYLGARCRLHGGAGEGTAK